MTSSKNYLSYRKYEGEEEKLKGINLLTYNQLSLILKYSKFPNGPQSKWGDGLTKLP